MSSNTKQWHQQVARMPSTTEPNVLLQAAPANNLPFGRGQHSEQHFAYDHLAGPSTSSMAPPADFDQSQASAAPLYSFEELGRWATDSNCTALIHALLASFSVILVSELGDKTFIITAIMAMKNSRSLVFISSASALLLMTILSVGMGVAASVIPELYTHYASIVLFLCFGLKMLKESYDMTRDAESNGGESEFDEVTRELDEKEAPPSPAKEQQAEMLETVRPPPLESQELEQAYATSKPPPTSERYFSKLWQTLYIAPIVIKVFTMIFVAEWGDRSQISTVILAAREDVVGVFIGSLSGHIFCTGLAVIGGRFVADMISVRTMTLLGGIIFLFFAVFAIATGPGQS